MSKSKTHGRNPIHSPDQSSGKASDRLGTQTSAQAPILPSAHRHPDLQAPPHSRPQVGDLNHHILAAADNLVYALSNHNHEVNHCWNWLREALKHLT